MGFETSVCYVVLLFLFDYAGSKFGFVGLCGDFMWEHPQHFISPLHISSIALSTSLVVIQV